VTGRAELPGRGLFAVHEGVTLAVASAGSDEVLLVVPDGATALPTHHGEGTTRAGARWIRVRKALLERYYSVHVVVRWQGEEFGLGRVVGDEAEILGGSPAVARRLGLEGDQHNGFCGTVPVAELTVVDVREREIDA